MADIDSDTFAAVLRPGEAASRIEPVALDPPRDNEVLVRIVATGICHTDQICRDGFLPLPRPIVLGHEGAGIVAAVGAGVTDLAVGDHVVLSFSACGECAMCRAGIAWGCTCFMAANMSGRRLDGSTAMRGSTGEIAGHFYGQSSFASHSVVPASAAVKVRADAPLELLGPLGCGVMTGAGAVLKVLRPPAGASLAVFGAGGVGLSAVMAARVAGCGPIVVVEPNAGRRALALELGATQALDPAEGEVAARIGAITGTGAGYAIDTSGVPAVIDQAIAALSVDGHLAMISANALDAVLPTPLMAILPRGLHLHGVNMGCAVPRDFIPQLVDLFMAGRFPIDRLVRFYDFAEIDRAFADQHEGLAIKPILRMPRGE